MGREEEGRGMGGERKGDRAAVEWTARDVALVDG